MTTEIMAPGVARPLPLRTRKAVAPAAKKRPGHAAAVRPFELSDAWRAWSAENLLRGVGAAEVIALLEGHGVPRVIAAREVDAIVRSPIFSAAYTIAQRERRLSLACELRAEVARLWHPSHAAHAAFGSPGTGERTPVLERRPCPSAAEFFARYYATSTPVMLTGAMDGWRALGTWTPEWFKRELGSVDVEVTSGRDADPDYDMNFKAHSVRTTIASYIDRVLAAPAGNDFYMVANNRALERPSMRRLFDDLALDPEMFDTARLAGGSSLWIGPAGTKTPLHHDTTNILFCQVFGRKTVRLASPLDPAFMHRIRGVYSGVDLDVPEQGAPTFEVTMAPGDALFIPVGWWHDVQALDVSISLSITCFRRPNAFDWYVPGACV